MNSTTKHAQKLPLPDMNMARSQQLWPRRHNFVRSLDVQISGEFCVVLDETEP